MAKRNTILANIERVDPSRTTSLRRVFSSAASRRITSLARIIKTSIVTEDVFGLIDQPSHRGLSVLRDMTTPGRKAFQFKQDPQKINSFLEWIREMIRIGVLEVEDLTLVGDSINGAWPNVFIYDAYKRGVIRARQQLKQEGVTIPTITQSGGIDAVMGQLVHVDRVGVLYVRVFNELVGITNSMDQLISRVLSTGMLEGSNPRQIAGSLVHAITGQGNTLNLPVSYINPRTGKLVNYVIPARERAITLARTEIIRAHAIGQLQEFHNWGVYEVSAKAEFRTAGDDRVCELCAGLEGTIYSIEEAYSVIPVHPRCRCIWLPYLSK